MGLSGRKSVKLIPRRPANLVEAWCERQKPETCESGGEPLPLHLAEVEATRLKRIRSERAPGQRCPEAHEGTQGLPMRNRTK